MLRSLKIRLPWWGAPLGLALLATWLLRSHIHDYKIRLGLEMNVTSVLISTREMSEGHVLRESDFLLKPVPQKYLPLASLLESDLPKIRGMALARPVAKNALLLWSDLHVSELSPFASGRIPRGYRAFSISVTDTSSIAHAIRSGDRIDLLTLSHLPEGREKKAMVLLQDVLVLGVGSWGRDTESSDYGNITLMVLPKEIPLLLEAVDEGKLSIALRNPEDSETLHDFPVVGTTDLARSALRNSLQEERNQAVEMLRGGVLSFERTP